MERDFDLIVIGTGEAGTSAAYRCRSEGWGVAIIDSRPYGGTCSLRGCDPKKVLVGASELIDWQGRMVGRGVRSEGMKIDWSELMQFKRSFTEPVPDSRERGFTEAGIVPFYRPARFIDERTVQVGSDELTGRYVLVATGARPASLRISGEEHLITSDQFLELESLPRRILFIGAGYISLEFAHVAARAGAQTQILHRSAKPLRGFDPDLVEQLLDATRKIGIDIRLNAAVESIEERADHLVVHASVEGTSQEFEADMVVHGAGRQPNFEGLDLDRAGVQSQKDGVSVNEYLQSVSNPAVYAAGDCAASGGHPLTPMASMEGGIAATNMLEGNKVKPDHTGVPSVVFTTPSLAGVGLLEEDAKEQGLDFRMTQGDTSTWYSSRRVGAKHSGFKVFIDKESDRILGAHLLGPHAEEVINIFALAIRSGIRAAELEEMPYAYPSSSSDIGYMV